MELKKLIFEILNQIKTELNNPDINEKLKNEFTDPFIKFILNQLYPYLLTTCIIFVLMFLCVISILIISLTK
tara:strand:+ start:382 stop:597 length:216 start_codon:yes stop_codon:yes gene_type:complete